MHDESPAPYGGVLRQTLEAICRLFVLEGHEPECGQLLPSPLDADGVAVDAEGAAGQEIAELVSCYVVGEVPQVQY